MHARSENQRFSNRVAKGVGVPYRFGGFSAQADREVTQIDTGQFIITNERVVFSGQADSKDIKFSQINIVRPHLDGIAITHSDKQKVEYYLGTDRVNLRLKGKNLSWQLSGVEVAAILRELIEG